MASRGIPTWHADVWFRSRAEAKWALFFDELGIKWHYEIQGFATDGECYLPDFTVFGALGTTWLEIKAAWGSDPEGEGKFRRFAAQRPQPSRAALIGGLPGDCQILVIGGDESAQDPLSPWEADNYEWRPCPSGQHFDLAWPGRFRGKFAEDGCEDDFGGDGENKIRRAAAVAKTARFTAHPESAG